MAKITIVLNQNRLKILSDIEQNNRIMIVYMYFTRNTRVEYNIGAYKLYSLYILLGINYHTRSVYFMTFNNDKSKIFLI